MKDYADLFRRCGYSQADLEAEAPRIEKVIDIVGLTDNVFRNAEERVDTYYNTELEGVRKLLRAWLLEFCDLVLSREEGRTIIYYGYPSIQGPGMAIKASAPERLYVGCPDVILCHTLGQIFDQLNPLLEAAEQNGLPPGHGLCSLQQIRNGALARGIIPVPDLVTGSSYYCDMGSKADELLHQLYGQKSIYIDGSMDAPWGEYPDYDPERLRYFAAQIDKLFVKVREIIGVETTPASIEKAMQISREMFSALSKLTRLMMADPMPVSGVASGMAINLAGASTSRSMSEGPDAVNTLCREVEKRVEAGIGIVPKSAPRVINFSQHFSDPTVTRMTEEAGLAMAASFVTVPMPKRDKSLKLNTPGEMLAEAALRGGTFHSTYGFARRWVDAVRSLKLDGVLWGYQYNCRPLAMGSHVIKTVVEKETGVPTLSLEMDYYESRNYSAEALRTRVEAFAEMLKARKAATR